MHAGIITFNGLYVTAMHPVYRDYGPKINLKSVMQDGLGDTIRVSLTEPPEEEIDPCRRLANLGMKAADLQQGVVGFYNICFIKLIYFHSDIYKAFEFVSRCYLLQAPFEEKHRHYFDFQRRSGQLPIQKEVGL